MNDLETAKMRLEKAVARLETAVKTRAKSDGGENKRLAKALENAQAECAELHEVNQTVSDRLDAAIGRLNTVLER
jgi:hypothetical protein